MQKQDPGTASRDHNERRESIRKFCAPQTPTFEIPDEIRRYFSFSERHHLVYCSIQKVGTSFWLQVMQLLMGKVREGGLFDVRSFLHSTGIRGDYSFRTKSPAEIAEKLRFYKKFLFVRDPFSRLFSAYMDKVFLPTRRIFLFAETAELDAKGGEGRPREGRRCLLNVTFQSFLTVITNGGAQDPHWSPMHLHCSPCSVDFDYVGKMETFMADTEFILGQVGVNLSQLSPRKDSFVSDNDLLALQDLGRYNYRVAVKRGCTSKIYLCQVFRKIWITLQTRGFISNDAVYPFPERGCASVDEKSFLEKLVKAHSESGNRAQRMRQRQEAMMEAYCRLPRWLLKKVEAYVHDDCAMFGYNCSVDYRFPEGRHCNPRSAYFDAFR